MTGRRIVLVDIGEGLTLGGILPSVALHAAYSAKLTARGGVAPYTFTTAGVLPAGMTLDRATGVLSADDVASAGTFAITVTVTDVTGATAARTFALQVISQTVVKRLTISGTYPGNTVGAAYSADLVITGGVAPYSNPRVTVGALPAGLTLGIVGDKLRLSGTPTAAATSDFTLAVDSADGQTATSAQAIVIAEAAVDYASLVLADAPLVYLKLDEASGTVATDSSGNGRHGTYAGTGISQRAAPIRDGATGCLEITALAGGVTIPHDTAMAFATRANSAWAVEICSTIPSAGGNVQTSLIGKWRDAGAGTIEWYMSCDSKVNRAIRARAYAATSIRTGSNAGGPGIRTHYVFESDGINCNLYINGAYIGSNPVSAPATGNTLPVCVGGFGNIASAYGIVASVSDVAIYDHSLGASRVLAHAQAGGFA